MATSTSAAQRRHLIIISADPALRTRLATQIRADGRYQVEDDEPEPFLAGGRGDRADLVILDVGDGAMLGDVRLPAARDRLERRPLIVLSDALPPEQARAVVRLQAADWLQRPFADADLMASLAQVEGAVASNNSRVSTFVPATGGAGATTLALMAAQWLATGDKSADIGYVDLDFQSASASTYLNLRNGFDLDALIANPERLDAELLDLIRLDREPGIALYSFERPDLTFAATAKRFVLRLLDLVAVRHRQVVIDLPNLATPWFAEVLASSDDVFVVLECNVPSLRQARRLIQRARQIRGDKNRIVPVVNKTNFKLLGNTISRGDIAKMLDDPIIMSVGRDVELTTDALNRALLPAEVSRRAKPVREAGKVFHKIFRSK